MLKGMDLNKSVQMLGFFAPISGLIVSNMDAINRVLQTCSLVIGVALGLCALIDRIKARQKRRSK